MKKNCKFLSFICLITFLYSCKTENTSHQSSANSNQLYEFQNLETRWSSFENITAGRGKGGAENYGAKGHASSAAYFYLDRPENDLPALQSLDIRTAKL